MMFWWSASITLGNNNGVLTLFSLYILLNTSVGLTSCITIVFFSLTNFDPYDHYAACCVIFKGKGKTDDVPFKQ